MNELFGYSWHLDFCFSTLMTERLIFDWKGGLDLAYITVREYGIYRSIYPHFAVLACLAVFLQAHASAFSWIGSWKSICVSGVPTWVCIIMCTASEWFIEPAESRHPAQRTISMQRDRPRQWKEVQQTNN